MKEDKEKTITDTKSIPNEPLLWQREGSRREGDNNKTVHLEKIPKWESELLHPQEGESNTRPPNVRFPASLHLLLRQVCDLVGGWTLEKNGVERKCPVTTAVRWGLAVTLEEKVLLVILKGLIWSGSGRVIACDLDCDFDNWRSVNWTKECLTRDVFVWINSARFVFFSTVI